MISRRVDGRIAQGVSESTAGSAPAGLALGAVGLVELGKFRLEIAALVDGLVALGLAAAVAAVEAAEELSQAASLRLQPSWCAEVPAVGLPGGPRRGDGFLVAVREDEVHDETDLRFAALHRQRALALVLCPEAAVAHDVRFEAVERADDDAVHSALRRGLDRKSVV